MEEESRAVDPDTRKTRRPRSRVRFEKRRTEIVDIAAALFARQGYHATSAQDLSDATGLQRGALYHYIRSKTDLLYHIHARFIEPLLIEAREIAERDGTAADAMVAIAHATLKTINDYNDQVTVFLHEWKMISSDERWNVVREQRREYEAIVQRILERGASDGEFECSDSRLAALAFFGMVNYSYQWFDIGGRYTYDEVAEYFSRIFLYGVARGLPLATE